MKKILWSLILLGMSCPMLQAAQAETAQPMPPPPPKGNFRKPPRMRGALIWRAFARLDKQQQQELVKLQHSDPEKFAAEMRKLAEQLFKEEQQRRIKINALIEKYQKSKDAQEKAALKQELTAMERVEFQRGLSELARILEEGRRRVAYLENELNKRRKNAEPAVEARVEALLKGEIKLDPNMPPPPPPKKRTPYNRPHPPFGQDGAQIR